MDHPTNCPHWCAAISPHRVNHFRSIHWTTTAGGDRVSVDLAQYGDNAPEVLLFHHGNEFTGESFTPAQALHLSRVLAALDHDQMIALGARLGAAAVIVEEGQS